MVTLNNRQIEIINLLSKRDDYITIGNISKIFDISQRTIRNDLDSIEYALKGYKGILERKPRIGVKLTLDERETEKVLKMYNHKIYSTEERALFVLIIIMTKEKTTFEELAEMLQVSKNTIVQDLKLSEILLEEYDIKIKKKSYYGIFLNGNEDKIRSCLLELYKKSTSYLQLNIEKYLNKCLNKCLNTDISEIRNFIESVENLADVKYSEESLDELEVLINFSLCRMSIGNTIEYSMDYINEQKSTKNYKILKDSIEKLNCKVTENEICYLLKLFSGAKSTLGNFINTNPEVDKLAANIIRDMCDVININPIEDIDFKEQMALHLKVAIFRLKNNLIIDNPMLEEIKYKMSFVYNITEKILLQYEEILNFKFPESEIAYIAMYFDALFERNVKHKFSYKVLIICNGGLATSSLLKTRIGTMIPELEVVDICRLRDVERNVKKNEVDFLISTVPFTLGDYKVIQVNPLLELSDIEKIKAETFRRKYENHCKFFVKKVQNKSQSGISKILPEKYSQIGVEIKDWQEAIKVAAEPLIKDKKIKRQYVSEMIKVIETLGNYMVFIPEIAFVHAEPTFVIENSVSVLVLNKPIKFGSKQETIVKVIVVLANKNENMNLVNLVNIITKEGNIKKLKEATCYEDIENIE
ncbi:MAG: BglG family transcription antiterminator [Epulopiscium sp.]|nr:BglG family transcription antiterminator [Candidatus Epulonipiscium sp.]